MKCASCGYKFNYNNPDATREYYAIEKRSEITRGANGRLAYCRNGYAPFGNTSIPKKIDE